MTVYLAGPINGRTDAECRDWRGTATRLLSACNVAVLDPMARDYRGQEHTNWRDIVTGDLADIEASTVVLARVAEPSWGTAMELVYAHQMRKRVIGWGAGEAPSPWLIYHCELHSRLDTACRAITEVAA